MSKPFIGNIGYKNKNSSWHLIGFPDGINSSTGYIVLSGRGEIHCYTVCKLGLSWAGTLIRMSGKRLPKRIVFGNLERAMRRGRDGKEKEWIDRPIAYRASSGRLA